MRVRVLFFGATAALVGMRDIETTIDTSDSPADILKRFTAMYPELGSLRLLIAVNEEYVNEDSKLKDGDEVAIFTAVSGG
ncbi:MAG: MoaD/ThiS family protein [Blastocatellia bacterium]|nr:MoaD/ThiS family protein [Blastocatellia bacterium]